MKGTSEAIGAELYGALHMVDLAGSEAVSKSGVSGDQLKEAQSINKSLSSLTDVFVARALGRTHIPFRNSKLTYLLKPCLSGRGKTLMVVNVRPEQAHTRETLSSLRFARQVKQCDFADKLERTVKIVPQRLTSPQQLSTQTMTSRKNSPSASRLRSMASAQQQAGGHVPPRKTQVPPCLPRGTPRPSLARLTGPRAQQRVRCAQACANVLRQPSNGQRTVRGIHASSVGTAASRSSSGQRDGDAHHVGPSIVTGGPCSASGSSARTAAPDASMHLSGLSCVEASNGRARVQNHRSTSPTPSSPKPCANTSVCTSGAATPTSPTPPSFLLATATPPHPNASELGVAPGTTMPWDSPTLGAVGPPHIATPGRTNVGYPGSRERAHSNSSAVATAHARSADSPTSLLRAILERRGAGTLCAGANSVPCAPHCSSSPCAPPSTGTPDEPIRASVYGGPRSPCGSLGQGCVVATPSSRQHSPVPCRDLGLARKGAPQRGSRLGGSAASPVLSETYCTSATTTPRSSWCPSGTSACTASACASGCPSACQSGATTPNFPHQAGMKLWCVRVCNSQHASTSASTSAPPSPRTAEDHQLGSARIQNQSGGGVFRPCGGSGSVSVQSQGVGAGARPEADSEETLKSSAAKYGSPGPPFGHMPQWPGTSCFGSAGTALYGPSGLSAIGSAMGSASTTGTARLQRSHSRDVSRVGSVVVHERSPVPRLPLRTERTDDLPTRRVLCAA